MLKKASRTHEKAPLALGASAGQHKWTVGNYFFVLTFFTALQLDTPPAPT